MGMYRKEPINLIMSGVESDTYFNIAISAGITRLLMSFLYIRRKGKTFLKKRLEEAPDIRIMLDSGAYTFLAKEEYQNKPLSYWEKYLEDYAAFIRANKQFIYSCVELDIVDLVGEARIKEWRTKYFKPLEEEGILVCYVWHASEGIAAWKTMCQEHSFIGLSLATNADISENEIIKMINTAKLNNTIVHGFAITRIELLTKVPFFSVDSTTWLVGTKFGELNWFDGRKWTRLKKSMWKRQYKNKFIKLGANWELLEKENPYEMIRVNLLVFKEAEKYIRRRLTAKMYWMRGGEVMPPKKELSVIEDKKTLKKVKKHVEDVPVVVNQDLLPDTPKKLKKLSVKKGVPEREDLEGKSKFEEFAESNKTIESVKLPSLDWFEGDKEDLADYVKELELTDIPENEVEDLLWSIISFVKHVDEINNPDSYMYIDDTEIDDMYVFYFTDGEVDNREAKVLAIQQRFIDNLLGKRNDFKDTSIEYAVEREKYLTEEEYKLINLTEDEVNSMLPAIPEVDDYDEELRNYGIETVRDSQGRFLKGQQLVRKPKNIYSDKYPKLACNTCYKAGDCPEYVENAVCAFDKLFKRFDARNAEDVVDALQSMASVNLERMQRMMMFEVMDGGMVDATVTGLIDQNINILMKLKDLSRANFIAQQRKTINVDGSMTIESEVRGNPSNNSILERIFMNNIKDEEEI